MPMEGAAMMAFILNSSYIFIEKITLPFYICVPLSERMWVQQGLHISSLQLFCFLVCNENYSLTGPLAWWQIFGLVVFFFSNTERVKELVKLLLGSTPSTVTVNDTYCNSSNCSLGKLNTRQDWKHSLIPQVGDSVCENTTWRNINSLKLLRLLSQCYTGQVISEDCILSLV